MEGMNILRNLGSSIINPYTSGSVCNGDGLFGKGLSSPPSNGGFTLLQGHIQLMAMVPNLPENQVSPRWKTTSDLSRRGSRGEGSCTQDISGIEKEVKCRNDPPESAPITPRMMPSASKFLSHNLPSVSAGKVNHNKKRPTTSTISNPRTVSNLSLPPKPAHPVTMPSFAKQLPGTRRVAMKPPPIFPPVSNQSSYHRIDSIVNQPTLHNPTFQAKVPQGHQPQMAPLNPGSFMNQCTTSSATWLPPQVAYQFMNQLIPPQPHAQSPQPILPHNFYTPRGNGPAGDYHPMFPFQFQQSPQHVGFQPLQPAPPPCYEAPYAYQFHSPRGVYFPQLHTPPQNSFAYPPPYEAQSVPCFGTAACAVPIHPAYSMQNFTGHPSHPNPAAQLKPSRVLPPEAYEKSGRLPVNSPSLPQISLAQNRDHSQHTPPQPCNSLPALSNRHIPNTPGNSIIDDKMEETIILEGSSSEDESKSPRPPCERLSSKKSSHLQMNLPPLSTKPRNLSFENCSKSKMQNCGPESNPTKIPSNPRVTHTPVGVVVNPREKENHAGKNGSHLENDDFSEMDHHSNCTAATGSCSHCKCCASRMTWEENHRHREFPTLKHHTPRKKHKNVVVAVHECFPSDSSVSDGEEEELLLTRGRTIHNPCVSARKETVAHHNMPPAAGMLPAAVKKRKPTLETILYKPRLKGESEEVFDALHDLSPDEVRLYTCDYLTEILSSEDWASCHIGLQTMVRMARHRPKTLLSYLGPILWFAFKHLTSAKSALCRAAIVTFKELFQRIGCALDNDLEKLTEKLVIKSLAPNKFIREECYRALEAMVNHCTLLKVLAAMEIVSKKPHVRAATHRIARMTKQFVQVAGVDTCLKSLYAEKLLPMLFCFMTEANNETRVAAKEALGMLMNHLQFENAVTKHVTFDRNSTEVFKKLDKMRGRNRYRGPIAATKAYNSLAQFKRTTPRTSSFFN